MNIPSFEDLNNNTCSRRTMICHYPEFVHYLDSIYPSSYTHSEKVYLFFYNLSSRPVCKNCGKEVKFKSITRGYQTFCSQHCSNSNKEKREQIKLTNIERYGGVAPACSDKVKNKMHSTCLEKYGVENAMQNKDIANKSHQTNKERYGGCGNGSKILKEKQQQTCQERYGCDNVMQSQSIKENIKKSNQERYGVDWNWQRKDIQEKSKQTCLERYGKKHYNNPDQTKQTMLDKYGSEGNFGRKEIQEKSIQTSLERYGEEHYNNPSQHELTCQERYGEKYYNNPSQHEQTCLDRYGVTNIIEIPGVLEKIYDTKKKNGTFNTSRIEQQFKKWLDDNNIEYKYQYKDDKYPFVCDFYFPFRDLYLEIQGSWTHGGHPFDPNNEEDIKTLNKWKEKNTKFYTNAIVTWTIRDVRKREVGKNLNWKEVFTNDLNELIEYANNTLLRFIL